MRNVRKKRTARKERHIQHMPASFSHSGQHGKNHNYEAIIHATPVSTQPSFVGKDMDLFNYTDF